jgi:bud site selection protein 20
MGRYRRARHHVGHKQYSKSCKTKHYKRDLDQIQDDLQLRGEKLLQITTQEVMSESLPNLGQSYCIECA